ncbi:amidohydrolase family protein, partial [Anaerotruncus rubiinfantis]
MKTFVNARLVLPDGVRQNGFLKEDAGKILSFGDMDNSLIGAGEIIDCGGRYLAPGFIDIHSHGGGGFDYMDGSAEDIVGAARAHLRHGTTSVLPTT